MGDLKKVRNEERKKKRKIWRNEGRRKEDKDRLIRKDRKKRGKDV